MAGMCAKRRLLKVFGAILSVGATMVANPARSQVLPAGPPQVSSFIPYASLQAQYDSNVYRSPNSQTSLAISGDPKLGDSSLRYAAGFDGTYLWSRQVLTGNLEASHWTYDHFTQNDHTEYQGNLHLQWQAGRQFDGMAEIGETHGQAPFEDRNAKTLTVNTARWVSENINVNIGSLWRLETGAKFLNLDAPIQNYPDFLERDATETFALRYLGFGALTYALQYTRLDGEFKNAPNTGPYHQNTVALQAAYAVTARSTFTSAIGYTIRDQAQNLGTVSGYTGEFGYRRQITPKTGAFVEITRAVNSYVAAGGSEIDTTAAAGLTWQPTFKLAFAVNAQYMRTSFVGQAIPGSVAAGRVDKIPGAGITGTYQITRKVQLKGFANTTRRQSNNPEESFNDSLVGLSIIGRWVK